MKKILIIGARGQLGAYLAQDLDNLGLTGRAVDKEECDVRNPSQIEYWLEKENPDILINTSAYNLVAKSEENSSEAMSVNFIAVRNLAQICRKRKIIFVSYSTDYVFDGAKASPYEENDIPNPLQVYGISKLAGEYGALSSYPEGAYIIRTSGLYGGKVGSPEKGGNFVLDILREGNRTTPLEISSEHTVNPTYAKDVSYATFQLLSHKDAKPGILYHLVNEGTCSWHEFALEIVRAADLSVDIRPVDRRCKGGGVLRPKYSALKNTRARILGIVLPPWKDAVRDYVHYLTKE